MFYFWAKAFNKASPLPKTCQVPHQSIHVLSPREGIPLMKWVSYQTMLGVMIQAPFPLGDLTFHICCALVQPFSMMLGIVHDIFDAPKNLSWHSCDVYTPRLFSWNFPCSQEWLCSQCWQCSSPTGQIFSSLARQSLLSRLLSYCLGLREPSTVHIILGWFD